MGMTDKQKRFCDEYLIDCNATQAAIRAGYSKSSASAAAARLLRKVKVKKYIDARMAELESDKIAKADEVLQYLTSVLRGESKSEAMLVIEGAVQRVQKAPDEKERLKAAELLGKRYAIYTDKRELEIGEQTRKSLGIGSMSLEEKQTLLAEAAALYAVGIGGTDDGEDGGNDGEGC